MTTKDKQSLQYRLLIRLWIPLFIVVMIGAIATFILARHIGSFVYDRWLYDSAMTLAEQLKYKNGEIALGLPKTAVEMFEWDSVDHIYEEVLSHQKGLLFGNTVFPPPPHTLTAGQPYYYDSTLNGKAVRIVAILLANPAGNNQDTVIIQVAETRQKRRALLLKIILLTVPLQIGLLILAESVVWMAVKNSLGTLDDLATRLARYEPEGLVPLAEGNAIPTEVRPLVASINQLIAKLSEAQDTQRRFVANAAHQIRTPLAALQVQTERALREADPIKQHDALSHSLHSTARLQHVTQQLLTLARSDRFAASTIQMVPLDLAELARSTLEHWADAAIARSIDLGYEGPEKSVMIQGEPHLLTELISNLVDNAIRYGKAGGTVTLGLTPSPLSLYVDDDGPGIPPEERTLVLERFYRRTDTKETGCGLGLSIACEIAERHHASLSILDNPNGAGTRVLLSWVNQQ